MHSTEADAVEAFKDWLAIYRRPQTVRNRVHYASRLRDWAIAHDRHLWSLTTRDLTQWLTTVGNHPATRKNAADAVRAFYRWAVEDGRTHVNPCEMLPKITVPRGMPKPTPDTVLRHALTRATCVQDVLMLYLASYGGLRVSEIAQMRAEDFANNAMRVIGKGGHVRYVPLHPALAEVLRHAPSKGWLFPSEKNATGHYLPASIAQRIRRLLNTPGWSAHSLRHRFATAFYEVTADLLALRDLLGHADVSTTMVYTRVATGRLRTQVSEIPRLEASLPFLDTQRAS